ncbi:MAG: M48 family metalloprotease [Syntrophaceae bacterium]|nr:M48 family metalloprotease [Syntrophaceae bacterium]
MLKKIITITTLGCGLLGLLFWIPSCAVNPVSGKQEFMLLSEQEEIQLGRETDHQIIKQYGVYEDSKLTTYFNDIGQRLAKISHRPHLAYHFKILDASVVNAFAVPGGYVYFTRGILATVNSEAELASLIGHEIGHITARHSAKQYSKAQLAQLGVGVGSIFIDSQLLSGLTQLGVGMLFLRFSRDNEREADDLGVEYSSKAGYDATQMASFFEMLEKMNPGSDRSGLPGWFSTHPSPENRVQIVRGKAKEWQQKLRQKDWVIHHDLYLRQIDGIIFGDDPRHGFVEENVFYHPGNRFQFPVPAKWKLNHRPSQIQIVSEGQGAVILLNESPFSSPQEAASIFTTQYKPYVIRTDALKVNGFPSQRIISDLQTQQKVLRVMSYFIEKDQKVFIFHGISSSSTYPRYETIFDHTFRQFKELSDPKRIHVKPDRIRIHVAKELDTLENTLRSLGFQNERLRKMVLLNGGNPNQMIPANTLIKVVEKGRFY